MATAIVDRTRRKFLINPNHFIKRETERFTAESPLNRLEAFGNALIFDPPLVGFANGDDPLFTDLKRHIAPQHLTPREALTRYMIDVLKIEPQQFDSVSTISFVMPISRETCRSNALEDAGPSLRWNHTRWKGQAFINDLSAHVAKLLEDFGYHACAPEISPFYRIESTLTGFFSNWSQRHIAYVGGLGTFCLNEGFITRKGLAHRIGSVVTDLRLEPTPRLYSSHLANCKFYATGTCGKCIKRCPAGALSEKGHDKLKCWAELSMTQKPWLEGKYGPGYIGRYAGCGLCQTGVPCEHRIPVGSERRANRTGK